MAHLLGIPLGVVLLLVFVAMRWCAPARGAGVPKWAVCDLTFTAAGHSANWYTDPNGAMAAVFTGPEGETRRVAGFWDGGQTFRVRFTPTAEGPWSWRTSSPDAGLDGQSGGLVGTAPAAGTHGFLRIDPAHRTSFVYDDGTRCFLWGQSYYDWIQSALQGDGWKTSVDNSRKVGLNKIRMHVYAHNLYKPGVEFTSNPDVQPYQGDSQHRNRDELNLPYWQKLDEMVRYMAERGMLAELIVTNPYCDNRQFGTAEQNDRFVRYVAARYAAFPNVVWCVCNEWDLSGTGGQYHGDFRQHKADFDRMGRLLHDADPWLAQGAALRPLSIHPSSNGAGPIAAGFQFFDAPWPTYVCIQYGGWNPKFDQGDEWGNAGVLENVGHPMPVVNDEYGYIGQTNPPCSVRVGMTREKLRHAIWGVATAGGYGSTGDFRLTPDGRGNVELSGDWYDAPEYGDLQRMISFFTTRGIRYWTMAGNNQLITAGMRAYALAAPGNAYVIYAAVGGKVSVTVAPGQYVARRYDPRNGELTELAAVTGGGPRSFALPDANDWVIWLQRAAGK